jgi:hypothetical protein
MSKKILSAIYDFWKRIVHPIAKLVLTILNSSDSLELDNSEAHKKAKSKARDVFIDVFTQRSLHYLLFIGLVLTLTAGLDFYFCGELSNQSYGLAVDLSGAIILGRGLLQGSIPIANQSTEGYDYSEAVVESLAKDSVDGFYGISFLICGIFLQMISVTFPQLSFPITGLFFC